MKTQNRGTLMDSLPVLAAFLGQKAGVKVEFTNSATASTNGDTIYLPSLPVDDARAHTLAHGFIDHEAGHVRWTDMAVWREAKSRLERSFLNSFEDARIEALLGRCYPGCAQNLNRLVRALAHEPNFWIEITEDHPPLVVLDGYVLYSLRARILGQDGLNEHAAGATVALDAVFPGLRSRLDPVIDKIRVAQTTAEALTLAREVLNLIQDMADSPPPPPAPKPQPNGGDEEQEDQSPSSPKSGDEGDGDGGRSTSKTNQDNAGAPSDDGDDGADGSDETGAGPQSPEAGLGDGPADRDAQGEQHSQGGDLNGDSSSSGTDAGSGKNAFKEALEDKNSKVQEGLGEKLGNELSKVSQAPIRGQLKVKATGADDSRALSYLKNLPVKKGDVLRETATLRQKLTGYLQAKTLTRAQPRCVGRRIDTKVLHRLPQGDPRVFRGRSEKLAVHTAVHLLVDRSGSMKQDNRNILAFKSTLAVTLALESVKGVNLGVSAFPGTSRSIATVVTHGGTIDHDLFRLSSGGGTPLTEALWNVVMRMAPLQEERKLIVVITDGDPDDIASSAQLISRIEAQPGIEIVGIGIKHRGVAGLFRNYTVVEALSDLPAAVFETLKRNL